MQFHFEGPKAVAAICFVTMIFGFAVYGMVHYFEHSLGALQ